MIPSAVDGDMHHRLALVIHRTEIRAVINQKFGTRHVVGQDRPMQQCHIPRIAMVEPSVLHQQLVMIQIRQDHHVQVAR